ncbi:WxL domain-containing protein [Loigolactobacillus zhaoyuanensis]|uniref:WxL domain-containing protein n=1 Tax=Loigolactobacillus zhaoyuanensis TaxID=2486017 RepID=UPI000F74BEA7|nr:WxL domain-containing protein [Loigolactobacillus zhaoyuanensis]
MTATLNTQDTGLQDVAGKAWATVIDKQTTRTDNTADATGKSDSIAGTWVLNVKADGPLQKMTDQGNPAGDSIDGAILTFNNTSSGQTQDVFDLTAEEQDQDFVTSGDATPVTDVTKNLTLPLSTDDTNHPVANAVAGEGEGADVFGWKKTDIKLTMPTSATVSNAVYETTLTWTLSTGIN